MTSVCSVIQKKICHFEVGSIWTFSGFFGGVRGMGLDFRAPCFQSRCSTTGAIASVHFTLVILEIESHELFGWVGLELRSS
jgi:hypothetical protein